MRKKHIPKPALRVFGARQNNLKGFDLSIPHDALTAVTGVSGSGKSSFAFDTLFAEGQWRYLESLPSYARMLMEKAARPDIDAIENVRPAIALEQRNTVRAARSTVGTLTEVYDLLRLLYAAVGEYRCVGCGLEVRAFTPTAAAREAAERLPAGTFTLEADLGEKLKTLGGEPVAWRETLSANGFARVRLAEGKILRLDGDSPAGKLAALAPPGAALVLDRLRLPEDAARLAKAFDEAYRNGGPLLRARSDGGMVLDFPSDRVCRNCGRPAPDLRPVLFSYNHPLGACPECTGFGAVLVWDPLKIVPDPSLTLAGGAIEPWQKPAHGWWQENLLLHARAEAIPLDVPWAELPEARGQSLERVPRPGGRGRVFQLPGNQALQDARAGLPLPLPEPPDLPRLRRGEAAARGSFRQRRRTLHLRGLRAAPERLDNSCGGSPGWKPRRGVKSSGASRSGWRPFCAWGSTTSPFRARPARFPAERCSGWP